MSAELLPPEANRPKLSDRLHDAWNETPPAVKLIGGGALVVFLLATACALLGISTSGLVVSQRWWLAGGWLMGMAIVMFSVLSAIQAYTRDDMSVVPAALIMNIVIFITSGFVVVSFWTAVSTRQWRAVLCGARRVCCWAASRAFCSGFRGFGAKGELRYRDRGLRVEVGREIRRMHRQLVPHASTSTNDQSPIEQIADWLTKTIVGVALVNLQKMPALLKGWAGYVSAGFAGPSGGAAPCVEQAGCGTETRSRWD